MGKKIVLSVGAGVNSTALLVLAKQNKIKIDLAIFSDTGGEHPETYNYLYKILVPYCKKHGIELILVGRKTLYEDYFKKNIIPYRMFRSCTDKYKVRPIRRYLKERYGNNYKLLLGIDYGEQRRARCGENYPLIDLKIDREGCKEIIKNEGLPVPIKSGCFFCPFIKPELYRILYEKHKDLFLKAEKFEKNAMGYPKHTITNKPLEQIRKAIEEQKPLFLGHDKTNLRCVYCHD